MSRIVQNKTPGNSLLLGEYWVVDEIDLMGPVSILCLPNWLSWSYLKITKNALPAFCAVKPLGLIRGSQPNVYLSGRKRPVKYIYANHYVVRCFVVAFHVPVSLAGFLHWHWDNRDHSGYGLGQWEKALHSCALADSTEWFLDSQPITPVPVK